MNTRRWQSHKPCSVLVSIASDAFIMLHSGQEWPAETLMDVRLRVTWPPVQEFVTIRMQVSSRHGFSGDGQCKSRSSGSLTLSRCMKRTLLQMHRTRANRPPQMLQAATEARNIQRAAIMAAFVSSDRFAAVSNPVKLQLAVKRQCINASTWILALLMTNGSCTQNMKSTYQQEKHDFSPALQ